MKTNEQIKEMQVAKPQPKSLTLESKDDTLARIDALLIHAALQGHSGIITQCRTALRDELKAELESKGFTVECQDIGGADEFKAFEPDPKTRFVISAEKQ